MKILNRAQSLCSDEYFISESVKFEFNQMYLLVKNKWRECDETTRSINLSDMLDSEGTEIFASLSEDGRGGDRLDFHSNILIARYFNSRIAMYNSEEDWEVQSLRKEQRKVVKVIGIQE